MKEKFIPAFDFNFLTKSFDLFISIVIPEKRIKGELIDLMDIKEEDKILDFGCGTGTLLILGEKEWWRCIGIYLNGIFSGDLFLFQDYRIRISRISTTNLHECFEHVGDQIIPQIKGKKVQMIPQL